MTRAAAFTPAHHHAPILLVKPQSLTSGTAVNGLIFDSTKMSAPGLRIMAMVALTLATGAVTDKIDVECKFEHADTSGGSYTTFKTMTLKQATLGANGAHAVLVEWPKCNLEGVKRYVRAVFEVTASAGNTGTISAIVGSVNGLVGQQRDPCQDENYDEDGYTATSKVIP